jgi:16S rRNA (guanine527-N7)-methyltransferase
MAKAMEPEGFRKALQSLGVDVSRETMTALETYAALLTKWQKAINLVSNATLPDLWQRHFLDSAQLLPLLPAPAPDAAPGNPDGTLTDFGSGAGFPGMVLAIMSGRQTHLVESDQRKAAFLLEVARATGCAERVQVHAARIEAVKPWVSGTITARALADLDSLLTLTAPFRGPGTVLLFPKGAKADDELTAAGLHWKMKIERRQSVTDSAAVILRITEVERGQT